MASIKLTHFIKFLLEFNQIIFDIDKYNLIKFKK